MNKKQTESIDWDLTTFLLKKMRRNAKSSENKMSQRNMIKENYKEDKLELHLTCDEHKNDPSISCSCKFYKREFLEFPVLLFQKQDANSYYVTDIENNKNSEYSTYGIKEVKWTEGNIDIVVEPLKLSFNIKKKYILEKFSNFINIDYNKLSLINLVEDGITYLSNEKDVCKSSNSFSKSVLNWNSVLNVIKEAEEISKTNFIYSNVTPGFKKGPEPVKNIYFELHIQRKYERISIPDNGTPFMYLGMMHYSCHLGKKRSCKRTLDNDSSKSKKIGCPALISIVKLARFPDFDMSYLKAEAKPKVLSEVQSSWDFHNKKVRYFIEYVINVPSVEVHQGHREFNDTTDLKYQEALDPRIVTKIQEIVCESFITHPKKIEPLIEEYVKNELLTPEEYEANSKRRKFKPSARVISYAVNKVRPQMIKEKKSFVKSLCTTLVEDLTKSIPSMDSDQELGKLWQNLQQINKVVNSSSSNLLQKVTPSTSGIKIKSGLDNLAGESSLEKSVNIRQSSTAPENEEFEGRSSRICVFDQTSDDFRIDENFDSSQLNLNPQEFAELSNITTDDNNILLFIPNDDGVLYPLMPNADNFQSN